MQRCPACGLDNLDSVRRCARCSRLLHPPANVIPPRAESRRIFRHFRYALKRRIGFRWRTQESRQFRTSWENILHSGILWALIPGIYQLKNNRPVRGWIFLAFFLLGAAGAALLPGTRFFYWALWCVILSQIWSVTDAIPWEGGYWYRLGRANIFGFILFIALSLLYTRAAAGYFAWRGLHQIGRDYPAGTVHYGQYVAIVPQAEYRPGDMVAVDAGVLGLPVSENGRQALVVDGGGPGRRERLLIDRILAGGPGSVSAKNGLLLSGGETVSFTPNNPEFVFPEIPERKLEGGEYCIFFSNFRYLVYRDAYVTIFWPKSRILGKIAIRYPLWERHSGGGTL